ncbi:MAG: asparagine--tRNA ligase, partial [Myxococcales bacterium]|nr:asparagine--tRNA ligase [Myxococcales bacterium]
MTAPHVYIEDLRNHVGETVLLKGWLYNRRGSGKLHFLELRDGTGMVQAVVFKGDVTPELFELAGTLTQETSVMVTGEVRAHPKKEDTYEMGVPAIEVVARPAQEFPLT